MMEATGEADYRCHFSSVQIWQVPTYSARLIAQCCFYVNRVTGSLLGTLSEDRECDRARLVDLKSYETCRLGSQELGLLSHVTNRHHQTFARIDTCSAIINLAACQFPQFPGIRIRRRQDADLRRYLQRHQNLPRQGSSVPRP